MNTKLKGKRLDPSQLAKAIVEQAENINPQPPQPPKEKPKAKR